jgi:predicted S18 family serine protease
MVVQRVRNHRWLAIFLMVCLVGLSACASIPRPTGALSQAELAVREAERSEAPQYAALELQTARENLDNAKQAMQGKQYETARRLAEKALVEAQLAQDKAKTVSTRAAADDLRESIESLREEISRASRRR